MRVKVLLCHLTPTVPVPPCTQMNILCNKCDRLGGGCEVKTDFLIKYKPKLNKGLFVQMINPPFKRRFKVARRGTLSEKLSSFQFAVFDLEPSFSVPSGTCLYEFKIREKSKIDQRY